MYESGIRLSDAYPQGEIPLVIEVNSADIIATLVQLKQEVEGKIGTELKMTIIGGAEAHLLATELAEAKVGVVLFPPRAFVSFIYIIIWNYSVD